MLSRKIILSAIVAAFALAPSIASAATNLITNGDFSGGNVGFSTGYTYINTTGPTALFNEGTVTIVANPIDVHHYWVDLSTGKPPVAPTNPMLVANGITGPDAATTAIWQQSIAGVTAGTHYNFSADVMNVCCNMTFGGSNSPSEIVFQYSTNNGLSWSNLVSHMTVPGDAGLADLVTASYVATSSTFSLRAVNDINVASGNDFALDNLSFASAVPEPGTWAMLFLGFGAIGLMMRRRQSRSLALAA